MSTTFPAPWSLRGRGHVFFYRFSREFLAHEAVIPASIRPSFVGGIGALMMVNYSESNCGPYQELLLIPGSFRVKGRSYPSISRIFVSTEVSVTNGRRNWGIPKDRADFRIETAEDGGEQWTVHHGAQEVFSAQVRPHWFSMPVPIHSALIPHTIAQSWEERTFITTISAHGWARPASLTVQPGDGKLFPDLSRERPLLGTGVSAKPFSMTFHEAAVEAEGDGERRLASARAE